MECEKCKSNNLEIIDTHLGCEFDNYNGEYYEVDIFSIKCNCCGFEFEEVM